MVDGAMIDAVVASLGAAAGAYGTGVLSRSEDAAAEATVRLGQRTLARLRRSPGAGEEIEQAVTELAERPGEDGRLLRLRSEIVRLVGQDPSLAAELAELLAAAGPAAITVMGDHTTVVRENSGIVSLGDHAHNTIRNV